jgi:hypothetical protein
MMVMAVCFVLLGSACICHGGGYSYAISESVTAGKKLKIHVCYEGSGATERLNGIKEFYFTSRLAFGYRSLGWSPWSIIRKSVVLNAGQNCINFYLSFRKPESVVVKVGLLFQDGEFLNLGTRFLEVE